MMGCPNSLSAKLLVHLGVVILVVGYLQFIWCNLYETTMRVHNLESIRETVAYTQDTSLFQG